MDKIIILGHKNPDVDSIVSGYLLEKILKSLGINSEFVIPDKKIEQENLDICRANGLDPIKFQKKLDLEDQNAKYILVDHNERNVKGEIIAIIDHHPTDKKFNLKHYYNNNISATACYICMAYEVLQTNKEKILDANDYKLAVLAAMVDTASFNSTKGRKEDKVWAENICKKYNLDYNNLYLQGLCLTNVDDLEQASLNGSKEYTYGTKKVESSYIQIENPTQVKDKINKIIDLLKLHIENKQLDAFVFIVHNMSKFETMYYLITKRGIIERYFTSYTSRGSTIMPEVKEFLETYKPQKKMKDK